MPRVQKIQLRTGSTAPSAGDFDISEPAWDATNKRLYIKATDGSMAQIGVSGSSSLVRVDASSVSTIYVGRAPVGTAENANGWTVTRTTYTSLGVLSTTAKASGAWVNRAQLTYS